MAPMKTMYVYILKCFDETFYTGVTNNLERRLKQHDAGINKEAYTHSRRPVHLVFHQLFSDPLKAIHFEKRLKKWSRKKKEAIINGEWDSLPELSKKKQK